MARLSFRCDDELVLAVDAARGRVPRERWLRDAIGLAVSGELSGRAIIEIPAAEPRSSAGWKGPDFKKSAKT